MADQVTDGRDHKLASPGFDDSLAGQGNGNDQHRPTKRRAVAQDDDDDDDDGKPGRERRKIDIKFIQDKSRRHITFSKRKAGIMKKAYELSVLTGTQVLLLVVSETGLVYTFTTPKLQPLVTKPQGKNLIQECLNAPSPTGGNDNVQEDQVAVESPDETNQAQAPPQAGGMPRNNHQQPLPPGYPMDPQSYQLYMQQSQQVPNGGYPMPPGARMTQHQPHHQ